MPSGGRLPFTRSSVAIFVSLALASPLLHAQSAPKRLSDWLLERPLPSNSYPLGLSWRVPEEAGTQNALRLDLLKGLSGLDPSITANARAIARLRDWLSALPVTGRVPVSMADARWLQANPERDPVLQPGQTVVLPQRPSTVTVVTEEGERCTVAYATGREAADYVNACSKGVAPAADWVWIAQPDGRVQRFGIAMWNREKQDAPAPGAWIWAPSRSSGWPESFSERLITFLATQGPAPDAREPTKAERPNTTGTSEPAIEGGQSQGYSLSLRPRADERDGVSPIASVGGEALPLSERAGAPSRNLAISSSDWGGVGLMQTPTARMRPTGAFAFHLSRAYPYTQSNVFFQPLDWLEGGFRYTTISNRLYGPPELSGTQSAKDKSLDVKLRLLSESAYVPQVSVGLRDVAGTGLFSGEYLVANKRTGDFDWSLGLGWGYVGGRGNVRNPLRLFGSRFDTRTTDTGQGGNFNLNTYFHGPASLFGGFQYQTPWERLNIKVEYDGNDYQHEPQQNNQRQSLPLNFGLVYRVGRAADITLGIERGNTIALGLTLHTQLDRLTTPKPYDPPRVPVSTARPQKLPDWSVTSADIRTQTEWHVRRIEQQGSDLHVTIDDADAIYWRERLDRAAAVLNRDAPSSVDRFTLTYRQKGQEVAEQVVDRDAWVAQKTQPVPPSARHEPIIAQAPADAYRPPGAVKYDQKQDRFESGLGLNYIQTLGGPDAFILYQISAVERVKLRLREDTWLQGALRLRLIDNYDKFRFTGPSELPRVRTFQREYLTTSRVTMPNLQLTHLGKLTQNQYYSLYGGYLEEMFAGAGGEWLYRPFASPVAFGVDVNEVRQRDFHQNFNFRDYQVSTGHATLYWETGWHDVLATVSAGRYLAGDIGATLQLSRVFGNGVTIGAFATRTNVSAARFGEGSFDKGLYVSIPFDAFLPKSSNTVGTFLWKPLTRDGGAKLARAVMLYDVTKSRDDRTLDFKPAQPANESTIPSDRREPWTPRYVSAVPEVPVSAKPVTAEWGAGEGKDQRLVEALYARQFRNIKVHHDATHRIDITLSNERVRPISRAVGQAARVALRLAPLDTREIRITYVERSTPAVTYDFVDLKGLEGYFNGELGPSQLAGMVTVEYHNPAAREREPLAQLGDIETPAPNVVTDPLPETFSVARVANDFKSAARTTANVDWPRAGAVAAGAVLGTSLLDRRAFTFAENHKDNRFLKGGVSVANALPWLGIAGAALTALDGSDPVRSRTGYAATEAGAAALVVATGLKYAIGRARPEAGLGSRNFQYLSSDNDHNSFPSRHTAVAWAVATPFAEEYNAPWLYGVAALTNLGRIGSREHWVSDTVAGSLIGYGLGKIFWQSSRDAAKGAPRVMLTPNGVGIAWTMQ